MTTQTQVSNQLSNLVIDYLEDSSVIKKTKREEISVKDRDLCIRDFFLNFLQDKQSFFPDKVFISLKELNEREFTHHLTALEKQHIHRTPVSFEKMCRFIQTLQESGGIARLTKDYSDYKNFPIYVLSEYLGKYSQKEIGKEQVASLCFLYQAIDQLIVNRKLCLFSSSSTLTDLTITTRHIISYPSSPRPTLSTHSLFEKAALIGQFFKFSLSMLEKLKQRLSQENVPDSERYFHLIDLPLGPVHSWSPLYDNILARVPKFFEPIVLEKNRIYSTHSQAMVIPSFSMIREYLNLSCGIDAISIIPMIKHSSVEQMAKHKLLNKSIVPIEIPQAGALKNFVNDHYCGKLGLSIYHIYLAIRNSWMKREDRRAINYIVNCLLKKDLNSRTSLIKKVLITGELYFPTENFGSIFDLILVPWDTDHKRLVLGNMAKLARFWKEEFCITPNLLFPVEKKIYDSILITITEAQKQKALKELFNYCKENSPDEDCLSQQCLGCLYYLGMGTKISYPIAIQHFRKANIPSSLFNLSLCYRQLNNKKKAFTYCFLAASYGVMEAKWLLGEHYRSGYGVDVNVYEAEKWFRRAGGQQALDFMPKNQSNLSKEEEKDVGRDAWIAKVDRNAGAKETLRQFVRILT